MWTTDGPVSIGGDEDDEPDAAHVRDRGEEPDEPDVRPDRPRVAAAARVVADVRDGIRDADGQEKDEVADGEALQQGGRRGPTVTLQGEQAEQVADVAECGQTENHATPDDEVEQAAVGRLGGHAGETNGCDVICGRFLDCHRLRHRGMSRDWFAENKQQNTWLKCWGRAIENDFCWQNVSSIYLYRN